MNAEDTKNVKELEETKKVLFVSNEVGGFITNGDLSGALSKLFKNYHHECDNNIDIRIVVPLHEKIVTKFSNRLKFIGRIDVDTGLSYKCCGIFMVKEGDVSYYFIENDYYLSNVYHYIFVDEDAKFTFFGQAVLALLENINFTPDIFRWDFR